MAKNKGLFQLIKTLNRGEKRAFKLYASKYAKQATNAYVRLFEVIDAQKKYDEQAVKKKFSGKKFANQLPVLKNQLFNLILASLRSKAAQGNPLLKVNEKSEYAYLLFQRGLFKEAASNIAKARQIATQYQMYVQLLFVLELEKMVMEQYLDVNELNKYTASIALEIERIEGLVKNQKIFAQLVNAIYKLYRTVGKPQNEEEREKYETFIKHPILEDINNANSVRALLNYYDIYIVYHQVTGNSAEAYKFVCIQLELMEENDYLIHVSPSRYMRMLNNVLILSSSMNKSADFYKYLAKLDAFSQNINTLHGHLKQRIFEVSKGNALAFYVDSNQFEKGLEMESTIEKGLKEFLYLSVDRKVRMCFGMALLQYYHSHWKKAHYWLDKALGFSEKEVAIDVIGYIKMLDLLLHFEQKNDRFLKYQIERTKSYLQKHKRFLVVEKLLLQFLGKLINARLFKDKTKAEFTTFYKKLLILKKEQAHHPLFTHLKIHHWVVSQIQKESFLKVITMS